MTQSVAQPSRDDESTNFTTNGPPNSHALWLGVDRSGEGQHVVTLPPAAEA
jgi:hypothetical protein